MNSTSQGLPSPSRFGIRSRHIILEGHYDLIEGIILIEDDKIHDVKIITELDPAELEQLNKDWEVQDYGDLYIFPGLIDTNVHLHTGYTNEWDNISYATNLAAAGGITTVVDNPIMTRSFKTGADYLRILKDRIELLKDNSYVDFAVFGLLEEKTKGSIKEILDIGVVGLKCYLLSCFQHNIGFIDPNELQKVLDMIDERYPGTLLALHPEIATERELYLSSPCRFVDTGKRLDVDYEIKPLEYGGAANKGSFLDDLNQDKKAGEEEEAEESSGERSDSDLNTPSKLRSKVLKMKEKLEIDKIVHFELLSYGKDEKSNNVKGKEMISSSDSDVETDKSQVKEAVTHDFPFHLERVKPPLVIGGDEGGKKRSFERLSFHEEKIIEVDSDDNPMTPKVDQKFWRGRDSPAKQSSFAPKNLEDVQILKPGEIGQSLENVSPINQSGLAISSYEIKVTNEEEIKPEEEEKQIFSSSPSRVDTQEADDPDSTSQYSNENNSRLMPQISLANCVNGEKKKFPQVDKPKFFLDQEEEEEPKEMKGLRFLSKFRSTESLDMGGTTKHERTDSPFSEDKQDNSLQEIPKFKKKLEIETQFDEQSPGPRKGSNNSLSPTKKALTPSSSLLNRRMSRRISGAGAVNDPLSARSNISSPSSDLSKISLLEVSRSPSHIKKTEGIFNKSYKVFLANRPQSWEENGVSKILSIYKEKSSLKILIQNISLASSFLKIRKLKKKKNETNQVQVYGETAFPYLLFSEKTVKTGETKFKAAPPLREKENRKLLVANLRLGGIDVVSSYHFYVPPRYKSIEDGNFRRAFDGFNTIGFSLQTLWTVLQNYYIKKKKLSAAAVEKKTKTTDIFHKIYEVSCVNPAKLLNIDKTKGTIEKGKDADFVIWDPFKVNEIADLPPNHLFCGKIIKGVIYKTILRGKVIFEKDKDLNLGNPAYARLVVPQKSGQRIFIF